MNYLKTVIGLTIILVGAVVVVTAAEAAEARVKQTLPCIKLLSDLDCLKVRMITQQAARKEFAQRMDAISIHSGPRLIKCHLNHIQIRVIDVSNEFAATIMILNV